MMRLVCAQRSCMLGDDANCTVLFYLFIYLFIYLVCYCSVFQRQQQRLRDGVSDGLLCRPNCPQLVCPSCNHHHHHHHHLPPVSLPNHYQDPHPLHAKQSLWPHPYSPSYFLAPPEARPKKTIPLSSQPLRSIQGQSPSQYHAAQSIIGGVWLKRMRPVLNARETGMPNAQKLQLAANVKNLEILRATPSTTAAGTVPTVPRSPLRNGWRGWWPSGRP